MNWSLLNREKLSGYELYVSFIVKLNNYELRYTSTVCHVSNITRPCRIWGRLINKTNFKRNNFVIFVVFSAFFSRSVDFPDYFYCFMAHSRSMRRQFNTGITRRPYFCLSIGEIEWLLDWAWHASGKCCSHRLFIIFHAKHTKHTCQAYKSCRQNAHFRTDASVQMRTAHGAPYGRNANNSFVFSTHECVNQLINYAFTWLKNPSWSNFPPLSDMKIELTWSNATS